MQELEYAFDIELIKRHVQNSEIQGEVQEYVVITTGFDKLRTLKYLLTIRQVSLEYVDKLIDEREVHYEAFSLDNISDDTRHLLCLSFIDLSPKFIFEDIETIEGIHDRTETLTNRISCFLDVLLEDNTCLKIQDYSPEFLLLNEELFY